MERTLVHPLSNLIASGQIQNGDLIQVDFDSEADGLTFTKEAEDIPAYVMVQMTDATIPAIAAAAAIAAEPEPVRPTGARISRRA